VVGRPLIEFGDDVIEHPHNEIVIVGTFPVLEGDGTVGEVVIAESIQIIDFLDGTFESLIDDWFLSEGVLLLQVDEEVVLEVFVQGLDDLACDIMGLIEFDHVVEDIHRAEYFCLLERHLVSREAVEGS
jgi:hypothetical protein